MLRAAVSPSDSCVWFGLSVCSLQFILSALFLCLEIKPLSYSSVAVEVRAASHHGKHIWQPAEEPDRQERDEDSHGGAGCRWENHHPVQA